MKYLRVQNILVGFLAAVCLLPAGLAGAQVLPSAPVPPGYTVRPIQDLSTANDVIIQLNNLTIQSVSGSSKPGMIYASDNSVIYCTEFRSTEGSGLRAPCPVIGPNTLYQISVADDTILLFQNRRRAAMSDFSAGDRINVFGFLDPNSGLVQALIVRDLSKSGVRTGYYTQFNNLRVVSAPSAPDAPATLTATAVNPCGSRLPCTLMSILYTVNINSNTQILNTSRGPLPLSSVQAGDIINVYGWYANGTMDALILRDLSATSRTGSGPVISGVSGPVMLQAGETGTWTVNASDSANGTLSYSVNWGDSSGSGQAAAANTGIYQPIQQSATFTHAYQNPGTYAPRFTVTNSFGQSSSAGLSVVVGGTLQPGGLQVNSPAGGEAWLRGSNQVVSWSIVPAPSVAGIYSSGNSFDIYLVHKSIAGDIAASAQYPLARGVFTDFGMTGGSFTWQVGSNLENTLIPDGGNYSVRVCYIGSSNCAESAMFNIVSNAPPVSGVRINSINPPAGAAGTMISLGGSGFAQSGNIVHFEMGGMDAAYLPNLSSDGSNIVFPVPSYSSYSCFYTQYRCMIASKLLSPGTYSVWVENVSGASNRVNFNLTTNYGYQL